MPSDFLKFPDGFFWGAATAAHQVEGNTNNDWSEWERKNAGRLAQGSEKKFGDLPNWLEIKTEAQNPQNYISGRACDHFNRFEEDFDIAKSLNQNSHRFSLEWSRIEPEEGKFSEEAISHYRRVLEALRQRNLEPFVTIWHWTNPLWVAKFGGPESKKFPFYFSRYAKYAVEKLGDLARFWVTLNEPTSVIYDAYFKGNWPPRKKNPLAVFRVYKNLSRAHNLAFDEIHKISKGAKVGFSNALSFYEAYDKKSLLDNLSAKVARYFANEKFLKMTGEKNDFLTVQYYLPHRIKFPSEIKNRKEEISDMGWEIYPEGLYWILNDLKKYQKPIYITENGLADARDQKRAKFIKEHLAQVHRAISEGADVRGYFYWSLLDNFEWDKGFWPRFGLVEINYKTLERKIRPSAFEYAKICQNNGIL